MADDGRSIGDDAPSIGDDAQQSAGGSGLLRLTVDGPAQLVAQLPAGGPAPRGVIVSPLPANAQDAALGVRRWEAIVDGWRFEVAAEPAHRAALRERARGPAAASQASVSTPVRAQIPGRITHVWVAQGEQVEQGGRLLSIEAMKMENEIRAPRAGTVEAIEVAEGELVELNDELLTIA